MSVFLAFLLSLGSFFHGGHAFAPGTQVAPSTASANDSTAGSANGHTGGTIYQQSGTGCWQYATGGGTYCPAGRTLQNSGT